MRSADSNFMSISDACSICFKHNVFVYRVPISNDSMKIEVDYDGRKKLGSEIYKWKTDQKEMNEKIYELYVTIARQIQNRGE